MSGLNSEASGTNRIQVLWQDAVAALTSSRYVVESLVLANS